MTFDDIIARLSYDKRKRLAAAAIFVPRLARGHGSLRMNECNATGCAGGENHIQERLEIAYRNIYGSGDSL